MRVQQAKRSGPEGADAWRTSVRAVVFDFDGTLAELVLDFQEMHRRVEAAARPFFNHGGSLPEVGELPSLERVEAWAALLEAHEARALRRAAHAAIRDQEVQAATDGRLFPFTRPLLTGLADRGLGLGVVTRNCRTAVYTVFPDIDAHVGVVLSRDDVPRTKPDPVHVLSALERLGAAPENSLMVGDHPMDIESGRRAGMWTAAVATGNHAKEALEGADVVLDDAGGLEKLLADRGD